MPRHYSNVSEGKGISTYDEDDDTLLLSHQELNSETCCANAAHVLYPGSLAAI